ncbi:MAG: tetratricopeptide repeat protein, partial [Burkholderiaceae bacterium]|nr:tetratricopeptide repeat protein [Burkholderiaceae bacterium]
MTQADRATLERLFAEANNLLANGNARAALTLAQQAWNLAPLEADCSNLVGVCAITLGDAATAGQCWHEAIRLNPRTAEARINLARWHRDSGRLAEAEACLRQATAFAPRNATISLLLG